MQLFCSQTISSLFSSDSFVVQINLFLSNCIEIDLQPTCSILRVTCASIRDRKDRCQTIAFFFFVARVYVGYV